MKLLFPLILTTFFALVHYLGYSRIVKKLHVKEITVKWLTWLLVLNFIGITGYVAARYLLYLPQALYFMLSLSVGVGFILFVSLILYEVLHLLQRSLPFRDEKRAFFKRVSDLGFLSLGTGYIGASVYEGSKRPVVEYVSVDQKRFDGQSYRVVQISDMHVGGLIDHDFVRESVATINRLNPDLVVITGDLTDMPIEKITEAVDELAHLESRFGTYYIPGNHEYFHGIEATLAYLKKIGIKVLENSAEQIEAFWIVGVYDVFGYRYDKYIPDIKEATKELPEDAHSLLLAHQPRYLENLEGFKPSLMLSGHTHGGQIWPFGHLVKLVQPYLKGLHALDNDRHIYVNSGIGFWGPAMRLGTEAEITCIDWS
ncbi:MAG: metallophosphoesterase [Campylobacterota bacterium]|nr:metallophosphoesterase [Campylobacterota bacterium]